MTAPATSHGSRHQRLPGLDPRSARLTAESALLGLVVGVAVVAPWTGRGYLILLDWVGGPHQAITPGLYGLDSAALDALPFRLATHAVRGVIGAGATSWLMVLLYFPIAASGVSALAGGGRWRRHPAALFAVCNPFVVQRIHAGHVPFLLSVGLLAWLLASAVRARRRGRAFAARPAGWYAVAMAVGPHVAWLGGAALLAVALLPRPRRNDLVRTLVVVLAAGCIYAYALAVILGAILTVHVSDRDLDVYATRAGPGGMLPTLAALQGFWRADDANSPQRLLGLVPAALLLVALVAVVVAGLARLCRRDPVVGAPLSLLAVTGLVLGAGVNGPAGPVYRTLLDVMPLFEAMREQQKWVALAMLAYAVAIGASVEALVAALRRARLPAVRLRAAGGLVAICGVYGAVAPTLLWGLGGTVPLSHYPEGWYAADKMMGDGTEGILFLPWHQYQPFDFTGERTVATPAGAFFRRPVLSSDAVELGAVRTNSVSRRTAYIQRLVAAGGTGHFGRLVAPLGVRYVVLARDQEAGAYAWLERQAELRQVLHTPQLVVYRVEAQGTGRVVSARRGGYDDAVALARKGRLGTEAVLGDGPERGSERSTASGGIRRTGATSWRVEPGRPGWVVIPEEWSPGWAGGGSAAEQTVAGTVAIEAGAGAVTVQYTPWRWLRLGVAASLLSLAALMAAGVVEHRSELSNWWRRRSP